MYNIIQISSQKIQEYFFHFKNKLRIYGILTRSLLTPNPHTRSCAFYVCEFVCLKLHPKESNYIWSFSLIIIFMTHYAMIHSSIPFLLWLVICHCINILLGIHWLVDELAGSVFWILWTMWLWPFIMHKIGFKYNFHSIG